MRLGRGRIEGRAGTQAARRRNRPLHGRRAHAGDERHGIPDRGDAALSGRAARSCSPRTPTPKQRSRRSTRSGSTSTSPSPGIRRVSGCIPRSMTCSTTGRRGHEPKFEGLRVAGTVLSAESYAIKDFLSSNLFPYQWVDLDRDASMRELAMIHSPDLARLPVVFLADGSVLVQPDVRTLAEKLGMTLKRRRRTTTTSIVVGGGPAGLAGAVYGASEGLRTMLVESHAPGGQAGTQLEDRELPRVPAGTFRRRARASRGLAGEAVRRRDRIAAGDCRNPPGRSVSRREALRWDRSFQRRPSSLPRAWKCAGSTCRASTG